MTLYEKYEKLIHSICRKVMPFAEPQGIEYEDLFQEGVLALLEASQSFDASRGHSAISYYYPVIYWKVREFVNPNKKRRLHNSGKKVFSMGALEVDQRRDEQKQTDERDSVEVLFDSLSDKERQMIEKWALGISPKKIGEQHGCTRQNVHRVLTKLKKKAKELNVEDFV